MGNLNRWTLQDEMALQARQVWLSKPFAIAEQEWQCKEPSPQRNEDWIYLDKLGNEISRLEFAFDLAENILKQQGTPVRQGGIEISFSFMAEWDLATEHEREMRELCNAWTLDGGEPRAFMANVRGANES